MSSVTENLVVVTFDTKPNITYASDLFAQTMGYSKEELLTMQHPDLCFDSFVNSASYTEFWNRLLAGQPFQDQVLRKGKGDKKIYLEANYFPLHDETHKLTGVCKICFDKTKSTSVSDAIEQMYDSQMKHMRETKRMMASMQSSSTDNLENTGALKNDTTEIGQITKTVHEIAYHTNILAVNTALQAVRSSENSNGFSVVAKEMRKLSKDVDKSSESIRENLQNILHEVESLDKTSKQTSEQIDSALNGFKQNQDSLYELEASSEKVKDNVVLLGQLFQVKQNE
ncbi:methyl-accepting chemotaxis protein [Ligilactobacillus acidipiscis]|uniref:methyl-accepting chemotaxis protein n=1 Tax=Ligilactobacillus acidipiscis TaxID=89059 RepID=UPI0023F72681|nr:methyl-accepting chemotaxis protein [Ligilactobacillus acidipiscis]WEV56515.1 methyl-accepting chemotaxis protein [Ligilactobacillus acidipiscis]